MRRVIAVVGLALLVAVLALVARPIPIAPKAWSPPPDPGFTGAYAQNDRLLAARLLGKGMGRGPTDVTVRDGYAYTGLEDGRIMRLALDGASKPEVFARTDGRPAGLQFDSTGDLIVADASRGLLKVTPDGRVTVLVSEIDGRKMRFPDDLDIAADGTIWFSDASTRFGFADSINDFWEASATGRLISYDPRTGAVRVRLSNLRFANGVAIAPDQSYVLVAETAGRRVTRLWLAGPKAGRSETFVDGLPGYPDNMSADARGFWVSLPYPNNGRLDALMPHPFLRAVVFRLVAAKILPSPVPAPRGWVVNLDGQGRVVQNLMDSKGERYAGVTSVNAFPGGLVLGSSTADAIAVLDAPTSEAAR
jgi:sugar lactone lactonase YvrE